MGGWSMAESGEIVWSLGCDVTIEDFDSSIEEIKVGDISLSGVVSVGELPVDVDSDRVNVMDLDVSFSVDGVHSTIIESQVVPHARIVEIGSYSPEATNEKRYAASAYSAKKIIDYVAAVEQNVINAEGNIDALNKRVDYLESHGTGSGDSHWYLGNDGKIHTNYDIVVHGNALIDGDTASGGEGEDNPVGLDEQAVLDLLEREGYVTEDDIAGLIPEVDLSDYYTTTQVDNLLSKKVNASDVYTKDDLADYKSWWDKLMAHITVDENGNVVIDPNLMVVGDVASGDEGEDVVIGGISGVKVNGVTYYDDNGDGIVDLGTISGGGGVSGDYLPLGGGTLYNGVSDTPLYIKSDRGAAYIGFRNSSDAFLGYYGFNDTTPTVYIGTSAEYNIIHSGNIGSYALPLSGGTITGLVTFANNEISLNGVDLAYTLSSLRVRTQSGDSWFGMMNDSACHIYTNAPVFYMNKPLMVDNGNYVIHEGNIGSQNAGSATKLQTARNIWGIPFDGTADILYSQRPKVDYYLFSVDGSNHVGYIGKAGAANRLYFDADTGYDISINANGVGNGILLDTNNNVGIGTTSPEFKLDVNGKFRASDNVIIGASSYEEGRLRVVGKNGDTYVMSVCDYDGWTKFAVFNNGNTEVYGNLVVSGDVASA